MWIMPKTVFYMLFAQIRSKNKCKYMLVSAGDAGLLAAALDQSKLLLQGNVCDVDIKLHNKQYLKAEGGEYEVVLSKT